MLRFRASSTFGLYFVHAVVLMNTYVVKNLIVVVIRVGTVLSSPFIAAWLMNSQWSQHGVLLKWNVKE